jgi:hypothetical protein
VISYNRAIAVARNTVVDLLDEDDEENDLLALDED